MKHPIYLALAGTAFAYLVFADARGLNPFHTLLPFRSGPAGASVHHK